jgi:hypothetical protein
MELGSCYIGFNKNKIFVSPRTKSMALGDRLKERGKCAYAVESSCVRTILVVFFSFHWLYMTQMNVCIGSLFIICSALWMLQSIGSSH